MSQLVYIIDLIKRFQGLKSHQSKVYLMLNAYV